VESDGENSAAWANATSSPGVAEFTVVAMQLAHGGRGALGMAAAGSRKLLVPAAMHAAAAGGTKLR
jgi:hypothetical protein